MTNKHNQDTSISTEEAVALAESHFWDDMTDREIAGFQLFQEKLCMPFDVFQAALEQSLGRPVFTHELGLNYEGIVKEFLGDAPAPTFEDIMNLIPEDKRVLVEVAK